MLFTITCAALDQLPSFRAHFILQTQTDKRLTSSQSRSPSPPPGGPSPPAPSIRAPARGSLTSAWGGEGEDTRWKRTCVCRPIQVRTRDMSTTAFICLPWSHICDHSGASCTQILWWNTATKPFECVSNINRGCYGVCPPWRTDLEAQQDRRRSTLCTLDVRLGEIRRAAPARRFIEGVIWHKGDISNIKTQGWVLFPNYGLCSGGYENIS